MLRDALGHGIEIFIGKWGTGVECVVDADAFKRPASRSVAAPTPPTADRRTKPPARLHGADADANQYAIQCCALTTTRHKSVTYSIGQNTTRIKSALALPERASPSNYRSRYRMHRLSPVSRSSNDALGRV